MSNQLITLLLMDLRQEISVLGTDGGLIGPSIYDTAQLLHHNPPSAASGWPALEWLISQQQPDGGWSDPLIPRSRDLPTLAAIRVLRRYDRRKESRAVVSKGLAFLQQQCSLWSDPLPDDLPVGVEILLPHLLDEVAVESNLAVTHSTYRAINELGRRRRRMITPAHVRAGTKLAHSWEALDMPPDLALLDATGSVGHSPAATAAWLHATQQRNDIADTRAAAQHYLELAAAATGVGVPGVVPTAFPITRFEQSFALYALLCGDLLDHPGLQDVVRPRVADLAEALRPEGIGFSDHFAPDGDDTACAIAVLRTVGYNCDRAILERFVHDDHFCAYQGEIQPSVSVTAHAVHGLALIGVEHQVSRKYLIDHQAIDGRWHSDKWNGSWLYTTSQAVIALRGTSERVLWRTLEAILSHQHPDGGWGSSIYGASNAEETAYAIIALHHLGKYIGTNAVGAALRQGGKWLCEAYRPFATDMATRWLAKTMYRPRRIARMFELSATLLSMEQYL